VTRINVTVGPALADDDILRAAVAGGVRGFRVAAARHPPERLAAWAARIAAAADVVGTPVDLFLDLPGPKTHLVLPDPVTLDPGRPLTVALDAESPTGPHLRGTLAVAMISVGDVLVLGDGEHALRVERVEPGAWVTRPLTTGRLDGRWGLTRTGDGGASRGTGPPVGPLVEVAVSAGFTGVFVSFVECAAAVHEVRTALAQVSGGAGLSVWPKVETAAGISAVAEIAAAADGVLLGRGDLLLDVGPVDYFAHERDALLRLRASATPVMVGTQLLTSMDRGWLPHRSELSFLSGLFADGVDGVLLSDETTVGTDPLRTIAMVDALRRRYGC
jgi:pyruvate kinase